MSIDPWIEERCLKWKREYKGTYLVFGQDIEGLSKDALIGVYKKQFESNKDRMESLESAYSFTRDIMKRRGV